MARSKVVKLEVLGKELTVNAPTVGVIKNAGIRYKTEEEKMVFIAASCTNMLESEIDALDYADFVVLTMEISHFLDGTGLSLVAKPYPL
jgi:hypothetical protein